MKILIFALLQVLSLSLSKPQSEFDYVFDEPQTRQCSEYEDKGYRCVPYYTCDECNAIIIDGAGLFDPRNTVDTCKTSKEHEKAVVSECDKPLHVCCRHPKYDPPGPDPTRSTCTGPSCPVVLILQRC